MPSLSGFRRVIEVLPSLLLLRKPNCQHRNHISENISNTAYYIQNITYRISHTAYQTKISNTAYLIHHIWYIKSNRVYHIQNIRHSLSYTKYQTQYIICSITKLFNYNNRSVQTTHHTLSISVGPPLQISPYLSFNLSSVNSVEPWPLVLPHAVALVKG